VFSQVFQTYVLSVSSFLKRTLQKFYFNVSKINQMFYMLQCDSSAIAVCYSCLGAMHACEKRCAAAGVGCDVGVQQSWVSGRTPGH
jgi:hypothetical protein